MKKGIFVLILIFFSQSVYSDNAITYYKKALLNTNILKCETILHEIYKEFPESDFAAKSLYKLSKISFLKGNYKNSEKYLLKIIKFYKDSSIYKNAFYDYSQILYLLGKIKSSEKFFLKYLKKFKSGKYNYDIYIKIADLNYNQGNISKAIKYYLNSLTIFPKNNYKSWIYFQLGNCYSYAKQYKEAYISYKTVEKFFKDSLEYYFSINLLKKIPKKYKINYKIMSNNNSYNFFIQVGAFSNKKKAIFVKNKFKKKYKNTHIIKEKRLYKIIIGNFFSIEEANIFKEKNNINGFIRAKNK